ncbi:PREDICTED: uncharacterized protein LOC107069650 [Polistes dominula]|uniref:Uncharacterized protein LOC107069650 n=1 Tax=Polistes dominula TaxID=743375 RepID=A0ABM1IQZ0_POLDO|nr:PREDICTED: uncharacterized protein LOC107069650 [Polistes dominula]
MFKQFHQASESRRVKPEVSLSSLSSRSSSSNNSSSMTTRTKTTTTERTKVPYGIIKIPLQPLPLSKPRRSCEPFDPRDQSFLLREDPRRRAVAWAPPGIFYSVSLALWSATGKGGYWWSGCIGEDCRIQVDG